MTAQTVKDATTADLRAEIAKRTEIARRAKERTCAGCARRISRGWEEVPGMPPPWRHVDTGSRFCYSMVAAPLGMVTS